MHLGLLDLFANDLVFRLRHHRKVICDALNFNLLTCSEFIKLSSLLEGYLFILALGFELFQERWIKQMLDYHDNKALSPENLRMSASFLSDSFAFSVTI